MNNNLIQKGSNESIVQDPPIVVPGKKKKSRGFNEKLGEGELLADAMAANLESFTSRGVGEDFVTRIRTAISNARATNKEQERYKALQKETTADLRVKVQDLTSVVREGRQLVKMSIPQERWVEFGITATR